MQDSRVPHVALINPNGCTDGQFCSGPGGGEPRLIKNQGGLSGVQDKSDAKENIERMEMAHNKWNVTSVPLLRWRTKLKRASQECDNTLRRCRQCLQEEEEVQQAVRPSAVCCLADAPNAFLSFWHQLYQFSNTTAASARKFFPGIGESRCTGACSINNHR
jgi:hypothetical protein